MNPEQIVKLKIQTTNAYHQYWLDHVLFSWQWWVFIITSVLLWIVWWKFVDKNRLHMILNFGLITSTLSMIGDIIGSYHNAWTYPIQVYWALMPALIPFDLVYIPVGFMLTFQRYDHGLKFFISFIILSALYAFVGEPIMHLIGAYQMYNWRYIYSFIGWMILALTSKFTVTILNKNAETKQ